MFALRVAARARASLLLPVRAMSTATKEMTIRDAINSALDEELERDPKVFIIGASRAPGARSRARALRAHV